MVDKQEEMHAIICLGCNCLIRCGVVEENLREAEALTTETLMKRMEGQPCPAACGSMAGFRPMSEGDQGHYDRDPDMHILRRE